MDVGPPLFLALWVTGLAAGAAVVAWWRVVGPGYSWLAAGVIALFGTPTVAAGAGGWAWIAIGLALVGGGAARSPRVAAGFFGASAVTFGWLAVADSPVVGVVTGALCLGGITSEMMLGHWFLIDPRLPRWSLRALTLSGGVGLIADFAYLASKGALDWRPADTAIGWTFIVLTSTTALLVTGVWFALQERRYTGVMAATGLSYLATLTAFGAAVLGRLAAFPS